MSDTETSRPLLAQLAWWFHPRMEEVAVEALAHILNRYPASRGGVNELLVRAVPNLRVSHETFETEAADLQRRRPDMLQKGDDGEERLFIEAKFYAGLTRNQPVPYLERLPKAGVSALMFLAPRSRVEELWPRLLKRLDEGGLPHSAVRPYCARINGTGKHLLITHWTTLLDSMGGRLEGSETGLAELQQLRGLVRFAEDREAKARRPGKGLVEDITKIGRQSGWLDTKRLNAAPRSYGYGRYARFGSRYTIGVWLGINRDLWEESDSTPLWLDCRKHWTFPPGHGWNERVQSILKDRMGGSVKEVGKTLWVPVNPERGKGADSYAAALERIVEMLDELAELSPP
ncbi:hypothetical protein [Candidatus Palauibacter sp.]|uniref:hypothetical protein n=1 Tax=Candidatus Palauibacter sp. TaxID=3101350 RepID=UPI003B0110C7